MRSSDNEARLLNYLGTLNILPCLVEFVWAMFVILIYANPSVPSLSWHVGYLGHGAHVHTLFEPYDRLMLICNSLRIIALIYVFFQFASLIIGLISARKPQCVKVWRVLCIINIVLCFLSTNVISAGITGYIFAKLGNFRDCSDNKC
ncbi:MAG: hypothetical protein K2N38_03720 [Oscillospiraceae bacterium]|nr:hypothetical protein [Oscillospiraceae bacterium]